jgi:ATP-dependent DNA helicase PIF1
MTQDQAFAILTTGANVFLTGEPGSGKTHTVNRYVSYLRAHGIEPALVASTGIAATHIGGMTVHSWAGLGILDFLTPRDVDRIASTERVSKRIAKTKVLILDEVSMLSAGILGMLDAVCRSVRRDERPFGGMQTVLVGDFFQLPPVVRQGKLTAFAYAADAWARLDPVVCYLDEQHRQDDPAYLSLLTAIRCDSVDEEHLSALMERISQPGAAPKDAVKLFSHNADVDRINDAHLAGLPGTQRDYAMRSTGPKHLVESLIRSCLSPEKLSVKPGASVMFTRNNPQGRFANGTLGTVTNFDKDTGLPIVTTIHGTTVTAEPMAWSMEDQGKPLAAVTQVPLRLAWAMTIHKSQGMSLDRALVDLRATFEYGQGYVALSRLRRFSGLYLLGCNRRALEVHPDITAQDRAFRAASMAAESVQTEREPDRLRAAQERFIAACGGTFGAPKKAPTSGEGAIFAMRKVHPKAYVRWTDDEERALIAAFNDGQPPKAIAERLGRKRGGIVSRLKKLGLLEE